MNKVLVDLMRQNIKEYEDLAAYIDDYSSSSDVSLGNLRRTFVFLFCFLVSMAVLCVIDALDLLPKVLAIGRTVFKWTFSRLKRIGRIRRIIRKSSDNHPKQRKWSIECREYLDIARRQSKLTEGEMEIL